MHIYIANVLLFCLFVAEVRLKLIKNVICHSDTVGLVCVFEYGYQDVGREMRGTGWGDIEKSSLSQDVFGRK